MLNRKNILTLIIITLIFMVLLGAISFLIFQDLFIAMFALFAGIINILGYLIFFVIYKNGVSIGKSGLQILLKYAVITIVVGGCVLYINSADLPVETKDGCLISLMIGLSSSIFTPFIFTTLLNRQEKKGKTLSLVTNQEKKEEVNSAFVKSDELNEEV